MRPPTRLAILLLLAAACSSRDAPKEEDGAAHVVRNGERGAWSEGQAWRLVPEATLGRADGEGPELFAQIVDLDVDGMGRVWIADGQMHQVRVFHPDGRHVRSLGRKGGGPAEFDGIAGMDWSADGRLWVLDSGNMRYSVWDTTGAFVATHRREINTSTTPWPLGFDPQGRLYDFASVTAGEEARRLVRYGPGLQPQDTFTVPPFQDAYFESVTTQQGNNHTVNRISVPFAPVQTWRMDPTGSIWVNVSNRYRLERHRFDGTVDRVVEREARPEPIDARQRAMVERTMKSFEQQGVKIDRSRIPDTQPLVADFFFGDDGTMWVMPFRGDAMMLDVFDADGRYLGEVRLPGRISPSPAPVVRGNRLVGVTMNADGVPSVVVWRVEKSAG